jgi:hypothetical protein
VTPTAREIIVQLIVQHSYTTSQTLWYVIQVFQVEDKCSGEMRFHLFRFIKVCIPDRP